MATTTKRPTTSELATAIVDTLEPHRERLATSGHPLPAYTACVDAIAGCLNKRNGTWRRTKPDGNSNAPHVLLWTLVKFHNGNGSLWGYPHFAPAELRESMDTLAIVLLQGKSTAADAWQRALNG